MKVEIDTKVLSSHGLTATSLLLLHVLYARDEKLFDELMHPVQREGILKLFIGSGFITCVNSAPNLMKVSINDIFLTPKTIKLVGKRNKTLVKKEVSNWINEYREIFPKGLNVNNHPYKGNKQGCIDKMTNFIVNNPDFDQDLILKVTKYYVSGKAKVNYDFMSEAHYFIEKNGSSPMEGLCEAMIEGAIPDGASVASERKIFNI